MATLHYTASDLKVFTPVSAAIGQLSNGPGTIIVLVKTTTAAAQDFCGLVNSGLSNWYHAIGTSGTNLLGDDDGASFLLGLTAQSSTTNWMLFAVDWPATAAPVRFHFRNQTGLSAWTHENSTANTVVAHAGPGTSGWLRCGYFGDNNTGAKDMALCAVWPGVRFSDSDYGLWTKTSDLFNHPLGPPGFLCQLNAATLVDLMGGSTYSSANSSGTTLTGADPDNWVMDGIGSAAGISVPPRPLLMTLMNQFKGLPILGQLPILLSSAVGPDVLNLGDLPSAEALSALNLTDSMALGAITSSEALSALNFKDLISLGGVTSAEALSALLLKDIINLGGISSSEALSALTLGATDTLNLGGILTSEALSSLLLRDNMGLAGIVSAETLSALRLLDQISLAGVATAENVPALFQSAMGLQGISSQENVPGLTLTEPGAGTGSDSGRQMKGYGT